VNPPAADERDGARSPDEPDAAAAEVRAAVLAVRAGDRDAFGRLVARYGRRLFGLTLMMVRVPAAAEDVTQETFVRAFTHLDAYDEKRPFFPWLATIAVRLSQNWLTRHGRLRDREGTELDESTSVESSPDPLETYILDESARRLWQSVSALPSGERTAVILYYREEMTVSDIARALGVASGTVKTLLFRARRRLRRILGRDGMPREPENSR